MDKKSHKAYIIAVDMGYGHQRAVFPLIDISATPDEWNISEPTIISANNYPNIPKSDRRKWEGTRKFYEFVSRLNGFPILGKRIFNMMDYFQRIAPFYPKRDLSRPILQTKQIYKMIENGLGKHLIATLNKKPLPLLTSFFIPAFFAEEHGYKGDIFCLCTDTDISRAWAPMYPKKSRIIYLAPNNRVKQRLILYGVLKEKIIVTGFPLPKEAIGDNKTLDLLKKTVSRRITNLDPKGIYQKKYEKNLSLYLGKNWKIEGPHEPLTLTFAVGGAGAQADIGVSIIKSLAPHIKKGKIKLNLIAGISKKVVRIYERAIERFQLEAYHPNKINILYRENKFDYFREFNKTIIDTDILWTKPSELSFYVGLGLPIVIAPALGSQEESNKSWLHMVGAGFEEDNPEYTSEWLFDWLDSGWLAGAAMSGFMNAPKRGTKHIEDLILSGVKTEIEDIHFI